MLPCMLLCWQNVEEKIHPSPPPWSFSVLLSSLCCTLDLISLTSRRRNRADIAVAPGNAAATLNSPVSTETADKSRIPNSNGNCSPGMKKKKHVLNIRSTCRISIAASVLTVKWPVHWFVIQLLRWRRRSLTAGADTHWVSEHVRTRWGRGSCTQTSRCGSQPRGQIM